MRISSEGEHPNMRRLLISAFCLTWALWAAEVTGQYVGTLKGHGPDGEREGGGAIVIKKQGETLAVTAGPTLDRQSEASNVKLEGDRLTFELGQRDGDPWKFDLKVDEKRITGTIVMSRGGETMTAKLDFAKQ